jgi:hypothetical protein
MNLNYEKRIHPKMGTYLIAESRDIESLFTKSILEVAGLTVNIGEKTTLYDWFTCEVEYCGIFDNYSIFYLGESKGLHYYDATVILTPTRIGKKYREHSFRDAFLKEKDGVKYWK